MPKAIDHKAIKKYYLAKPMSIERVAKHFNLCNVTVSRSLKKSGCHIYTRQELLQENLKVDYFENIDSENKAYLLGLFMTDGCIFKNKNKNSLLFSIQLQGRDCNMISWIKKELQAPRKIVIDKRDNSESLSIINDSFINNLIDHGMTSPKNKRGIPDIPDKLMSHFLRGFFDGDGSLVIEKSQNKIKKSVVFIGTYEQLNFIKQLFANLFNVNDVKIRFEDSIYMVKWRRKRDIRNICSYLYNNSHIYLQRKYNRYLKYVA